MLGSVSDAEDIVQEALLRLHTALSSEHDIASPQAYLATIVTRLCIDELRSARRRRETYIGEWLPEPLVGSTEKNAAQHVEMVESLSMAFLILLESLSPEERAVLLLRDVFDYDYADVARIVGKTEVATRQLAVRARARVLERRPRFDVDVAQRDAIAEQFFVAIETGDVGRLEALLAEDVSLHGDGGGKVPALARAVHGRKAVAHTLLNWARVSARVGGYEVRRTVVNGQAGAVIMTTEGQVISVWALDVIGDTITAVRAIVNPDKLRHFGNTMDFGAWLRR
jgi:RNA polymerase sigma-70 factor (ECF subfamily)